MEDNTMVKFEDRNDLVLASLHVACEANDSKVLRNMLRQFFGPTLKDLVHSQGLSKYVIDDPELVAGVRRLALVCSVNGSSECLDLLHKSIAGGIDPDTTDDEGTPCLQLAINNYNEELAALLIEIGADVNKLDQQRRSPLHWAVVCQQLDIVSLLLAKKAEKDRQDELGATPLHYAVRMCCQTDVDHITALDILQRLLIFRASVDKTDVKGRTPLMWASEMGVGNVCRMLIAKGADVSLVDQNGSAAAHMAAAWGTPAALIVLARFGKADMNQPNAAGHTPLAIAIATKRKDCVQALVSVGAKLEPTKPAALAPALPPPPPPPPQKPNANVTRRAIPRILIQQQQQQQLPTPKRQEPPPPAAIEPPKPKPNADALRCYKQQLHLPPRPPPPSETKQPWVDVGTKYSSATKPRSDHQPTWITYTRNLWLPSRNIASDEEKRENVRELAKLWHQKVGDNGVGLRSYTRISNEASSNSSGSGSVAAFASPSRDTKAEAAAASSKQIESKLFSAIRLKVQQSIQEHEAGRTAAARVYAAKREKTMHLRSSYLATKAIKVLTSPGS